MARAYKCDRCGAYYDDANKSNNKTVYEYFTGTTARTKRGGDLCHVCSEKFAKWWNKPKGGESL